MNDDNQPESKSDLIREIGIWVIRAMLCGGAIYCAATGKGDLAGTLAGVAVVSFFLL